MSRPYIINLSLTAILMASALAASSQFRLTGKVISQPDNKPVEEATIIVGEKQAKTLATGVFSIIIGKNVTELTVRHLSFIQQAVTIPNPLPDTLIIRLQAASNTLHEVSIVNTGFQALPKERATGSFVQLSAELLNRRASTGIIDRLEDITPGLAFNRSRNSASTPLSIRGQSTIFANSQPLIVIDNFPYDGDINSLNPADVESITVLKDAAAASIWGARSGNGVIVITTRKGREGSAPKITFNLNSTIGGKPDLFYQPRMSSTDFIELERALFAKGVYQSAENSIAKVPLSPVVELLIGRRNGTIPSADADRQIELLKQYDVRKDQEKYFYRTSWNQQYSIAVSGGSNNQTYYLSAGADRNRSSLIKNSLSRVTVNGNHSVALANQRLRLTTGINVIRMQTRKDNSLPIVNDLGYLSNNTTTVYPYMRLADDNGNAVAIVRDYRLAYAQNAPQLGLLDWQYKPLDEVGQLDFGTAGDEYRLNLRATYRLPAGFDLSAQYQYGRIQNNSENLYGANSYFSRNMINRFTQTGTSGVLSFPVPMGAIADFGHEESTSHNFRTQLNYSYQTNNHELNAIAGYDLKDVSLSGTNYRIYGYDQLNGTGQRVDYITTFAQYNNPASKQAISNIGDAVTGTSDRYLSYFFNGGYTYLSRYTFSLSGRIDRSNLFGVRTNQKQVPLYSTGLSWNISREPFYTLNALPLARLRLTYGYNGNVDKSLSAYTTANYLPSTLIPVPYAIISNPPNPELRWEKLSTVNLGIDFSTSASRVQGSIDLFLKRGRDLIGSIPYAPSTGITSFRGNNSDIKGKGIDLSVTTRNIDKKLKWSTAYLVSHARDQVTKYDVVASIANYVSNGDIGQYPAVGKPVYSVFSYRWAGLDPATGDPQGFLDNQVSKDYAKIFSSTTPDQLIFHGSARPIWFGAIRNTVNYQNFEFSINVSWKAGYYFRENGISYNSVLLGQAYTAGQYAVRWQKPGDEQFTQVPSMPATANTNRDNLYRYSEILVHKGDHIRLKDAAFSYTFRKRKTGEQNITPLQIYLYANNLPILWKATSSAFDPDYTSANSIPPSRTISFGLRTGF